MRDLILQDGIKQIDQVVVKFSSDDVGVVEHWKGDIDDREDPSQSLFSFNFGEVAENFEVDRMGIEVCLGFFCFEESSFKKHEEESNLI